jgi:NCS1 family nucleobase:cation symporter-1
VIALLLGVAPNLPGFLAQIGVIDSGGFIVNLYNYAWFIGLGIAGPAYWLLMRKRENT